MTAQGHLLDRLSELRPADRAWILNQLSGRERAALMDVARRGDDTAVDRGSAAQGVPSGSRAIPADAPQPSASTQLMSDQIALVQSFSAEQVSNALRGEPAWLIAAILSIETWRWSEELLEGLPAHVRMEVVRVRDKPLILAVGMRAALLGSCAVHITQSEVPKKTSRLREIIQRMQAKLLNRRLSLRL